MIEKETFLSDAKSRYPVHGLDGIIQIGEVYEEYFVCLWQILNL